MHCIQCTLEKQCTANHGITTGMFFLLEYKGQHRRVNTGPYTMSSPVVPFRLYVPPYHRSGNLPWGQDVTLHWGPFSCSVAGNKTLQYYSGHNYNPWYSTSYWWLSARLQQTLYTGNVITPWHTIYNKISHNFVVFYLVSFWCVLLMSSSDPFTQIHQGCLTCSGAPETVKHPQSIWVKLTVT